MLSKTADTNPRPRAVFQDATGNASTGIIEAVNTRDSKKKEPRYAGGITCQSGARNIIHTRIADHTATPIQAKRSTYPAKLIQPAPFATRHTARLSTRYPK